MRISLQGVEVAIYRYAQPREVRCFLPGTSQALTINLDYLGIERATEDVSMAFAQIAMNAVVANRAMLLAEWDSINPMPTQ